LVKQIAKDFAQGFVLGGFGAVIVLLILSGLGHCATTHTSHNSLGTIAYQENPYNYIVASAKDAKVVAEGKATSLRLQPMYTYALYDEQLLLCGDESDRLNGTSQPMVLTYERRAHRVVEGIACHELIGVNELKPKKLGE
jgi:hypothetical protein